MSLPAFVKKIQEGERVTFNETLQIITENYNYQPTEFYNGLGSDKLTNAAGQNEGSCRLFAFAKLHHFDKAQTLNLFGAYYWEDVLNNPEGSDHQNIRQFTHYGWDGIQFSGNPLTPK